MSGIIRGRDAWMWWWLGFASCAGVPLVDLGDVRLVDLRAVRRRGAS